MGRADQTAKIRGMFVYPSQVAAVVARHDELVRARVVIDRVDNADVMVFRCETAERSDALVLAIAESVREVCKLRADIELCPTGELPDDGKVIEDRRPIN